MSFTTISVARWLIFRPIWPKVAYFQVDWLKIIKSSRPIEKWLIWLILSGNWPIIFESIRPAKKVAYFGLF